MSATAEEIAMIFNKYGYPPPVNKPKPSTLREPHRDCFGYLGNRKCAALKEMYCQWEECRFYKNYDKYREEKLCRMQ